MPLAIGEKLDHYEITGPIGKGGMGEVYRALDTQLQREVAIKVLPPAMAKDPERLARFDREAKILAALNHPNIAVIYGLVDSPNGRALVMELVPGDTLAARIKRGPMPADEALSVAKQMAEALEAAHDKGVTHRDLKPGNVMVTPTGLVKVLDFGLAAMAAPVAASIDPENSPTLTMGMTQAGAIMGTAAYMSPEQAAGTPVDRRADIWSYGVVLWEMLTGSRLFQGDTIAHTLAAVLQTPIEFDKVAAPAPFQNLLRRCLDRNVSTRLRDIGEARIALSRNEPPEPVKVERPVSPGYWKWVAAFVALIAMGLGFLHFREQPPVQQVLQYSLPLPDKTTNIAHMAVSPDGHYVVMSAGALWVRALDSAQAQLLPGTEDATFPFWSPDSRYIAFFSRQKLMKISVTGGPAQVLCDAPIGRGGSWGSDGVIIFAPANGNGGLSRVPAGGGVPVPLTKNNGSGSHRFPAFLPDGRRFLYLANGSANGGQANGIRVGSLDSTEVRQLLPDEVRAEYLPPIAGNPLGYVLFVRQATLMAQPVDPQSMQPKGDLFPVADQVSTGNTNGNRLFSVSANGLLMFQAGGGSGGNQYLWFDRAGKEAGTAGSAAPTRQSLALSPDGKRLVTERFDGLTGTGDLWITDLEHSGTETRLTFNPTNDTQPVWSPDGSKIAFAHSVKGTTDIYVRASNGTGQDELIFESKESKQPNDWSRDGKFLIFSSLGSGGDSDLWALPMTSTDKKPILLLRTQYNEGQGQLSPDGRWLAYMSQESGTAQVYMQPFAPGWEKPITGKWQISTNGGVQPRWRADGKELFYLGQDRKLMAVEVKATAQSFDRSVPQALFDSRSVVGSSTAFGYAPSADGKRFLMPVPAGALLEAPPLTVIVNWLGWVKK